MLFVLIIVFRITAFLILWLKGKRESIKFKNIFEKRKKFKKECSNA
jgi:hypothetical protein